MPAFRQHATNRTNFVTQLTPFNLVGAAAGRAPAAVSSALNQITGLYANAGWGSTEATRGKVWVQWTAFSSRGERPSDAEIGNNLRRALRAAEATLGDGVRLLLPGESAPGRAAPSPPPPAAPPPSPAGTPEPASAATSTGRRPVRRRSATPPASQAEAEFIERSVRPVSDGEDWVARYRAVAERLATPPRVMPPGPPDANPFERCNRWLLDTALAHGGEQVWLLCLWDGQGGDGAGGTAHMVGEVRRHHGHVIHIDCRRLWQGASP